METIEQIAEIVSRVRARVEWLLVEQPHRFMNIRDLKVVLDELDRKTELVERLSQRCKACRWLRDAQHCWPSWDEVDAMVAEEIARGNN